MSEQMQDWLKSNDSREYFELLKMPSVGAQPTHLADCARAAAWLKKWLSAAGFQAGCLMPEGAVSANAGVLPVPVVYAERAGEEGAPTVLIYGHYDVQPPEPLDLWQSPPFEPTVRDERVYARGAQDDKGQIFAFLCGLRASLSAHDAPAKRLNIKIVLDGQEESGSGLLFKLLEDAAFRRRIAADVLLVCDTSAAADLRPAIVAGLRGVHHLTVRLTAASRDLHSGEYGGIAPNAAQGMAALLASLHNPDGSIAVAGFREGIEPPSHDELAAAELGFASEEALRADIGTEPCGGQRGKTLVQRNGFEPTIEINGIHTGYGGAGSKTVIPCEAIAKVSMRLVPGQIPARAIEGVKTHLKDRCPRGMTLAFSEESGFAPAMRLPLSSPLFRLAEDVLTRLDARGPVFQWDGASIPVVSALKTASGAAPLLVGWGQSVDRIHAPNESFSVQQFKAASAWASAILTALAE